MASIVGPTTSGDGCVAQSFQRKVFYANGLWWAWYSEGSGIGWKTSVDGITWSVFTNFGPYFPERCDIWYDETNNKICVGKASGNNQPMYYRQGTANADGTITWDSALVNVGDIHTYYPTVCKDSDGYPWMSYLRKTGYYKIVKATAIDGSAWGVPVTLWHHSQNYGRIAIAPLTGGKMLAIRTYCCGAGSHIASRLFNGSTWEASVNADTHGYVDGSAFCIVADGDNAHLVFRESSGYDILYIKYTYGVGWGSEETVASSSGTVWRHPALTLKSTDKVRVYYLLNTTTIMYRDRDEGAWQTAVTIDNTIVAATCISCSYKPFSNKFGVVWKSGSGSPYDVMFEGYSENGNGGAVVIDDGVGNTLTCDAIAWREHQIDKVAVRNVPLRTSGSFIDTGTYTLKNRKLDITIRLSDAQKTTLQAIFNQSAFITITAVQGTVGTWTYTDCWLRRKPLIYEYSKNSDGTVREWRADLEFDVSSFSYVAV